MVSKMAESKIRAKAEDPNARAIKLFAKIPCFPFKYTNQVLLKRVETI